MGSGCIDPQFRYLGTSWRWVVNFTLRPLYTRGKSPRYHLDRNCRENKNETRVLGPIKFSSTSLAVFKIHKLVWSWFRFLAIFFRKLIQTKPERTFWNTSRAISHSVLCLSSTTSAVRTASLQLRSMYLFVTWVKYSETMICALGFYRPPPPQLNTHKNGIKLYPILRSPKLDISPEFAVHLFSKSAQRKYDFTFTTFYCGIFYWWASHKERDH
jgi:hypothetical protein